MFHANFGAAQEVALSIRPVLELIHYTNAHLRYCDLETNTDDAQDTVDAALIALSEALHIRAIAIGKKEEDVPKGVADYITSLTRAPTNLDRFRQQCPEDLREQIKILKSQEFRGYLDDYVSLPVTYDTPFILAGTELETFAGPSTQRRLLDTIASRMGPCRNIRPVSITSEKRITDPPDNFPIFVAPTIIYKEVWMVECGDEIQRFEITHARDSEGPSGVYSVR